MASIINVDTINEKTSGNGVKIPSHSVQEVHHVCNAANTLSSTSYVDVAGASTTFTPKFANSKLFVQSVQHIYCEQYGSSWGAANTAIMIDGNLQSPAGSDTANQLGVGSRDTNQSSSQTTRILCYDHQTCTYTVSSTNPIIIKIQGKVFQAITTCNVNVYSRGFIRVTEIAQ